MPITNIDRLEALLAAVGQADVAVLSPAERRRLSNGCRRVMILAEPKPEAPKPEGVLDELKGGRQD
jgi:hypothetical protein